MHEPSEKLQKKMRIWCRKQSAHYGQLDCLVEDILMQRANKINNQGLRKQVEFLLKYLTPDEFQRLILHEMKYLRKRRLKVQPRFKGWKR